MTRSPSFAGVVLAAGESRRMGRDKALLPWRGTTFLAHAITTLAMHTDFVLVVAGANESRIAPVVYAHAAHLAVNPNPEQGQFSSLRTGLQQVLNRGRDAAVVALVDRPIASPETIAQLKQHFLELEGSGPWAVVPEFNGTHGHPIVIGREMIEAFLRAPQGTTARDVEHEHQDRIRYFPVQDPLVVANVDTPAEYEQISSGDSQL